MAVVKYTFTKNNTQNNKMKQSTQNGTYMTIRIHKHNDKNTQKVTVNFILEQATKAQRRSISIALLFL